MQYNYSQDTPLENTLPTTLSDELQIAIGDYITDPRATRSRNRDIIEAGILLFNCNNYLRYPFQFQDISPRQNAIQNITVLFSSCGLKVKTVFI